MDTLTQFSQFAATATPGPTVRAKTALILADTIGAIVGGAAEPDVIALQDRLASQTSGDCRVIGSSLTTAASTAALLNGTAGTTLEMDEGHQFAKGHPAIHVIPAVLAAAAQTPVTGAALLNAITLGYEAAARVGAATRLRGSMHPHGTWGAIGAAVGVLRLRGAPAPQIRAAMTMAASLGSTTSRQTMLEGGTVRNVFAGVSNQMGLLAADLAQTGFTGDADGVAHVFGKVAGEVFDPDVMVRDLGEVWEVTRNYFKMHSCCRFNHAALDALDQIKSRHPLNVDQIERVEVQSYGLAAELSDPAPRNVLAAKFSVPFAIATSVVTGSTKVGSFTGERVADPAIQALAAKVFVVENPDMSAKLPDLRPAQVTLTLTDGTILTGQTDTNRGDWTDPYGADEIKEKYMSLTTRLWSPAQAEKVWSSVFALVDAPNGQDFLAGLGA